MEITPGTEFKAKETNEEANNISSSHLIISSHHLISPHLISSHLISSHLVLPYLVLSCLGHGLVLSCLVLLGIIWGHFGSSWVSFWGSRGVLEGLGLSWVGLGGVLGAVAAPRGGTGGCPKLGWRKCYLKRPILTPQKGAKTELKTNKNRSQNHLKKRSRFGTLLRPSWTDLGPILAPSWLVLRVVEWGFARAKLHSVKIGVFAQDNVSRRFLGRSWADLRRQKGSKTSPFGT